MYEVAVVVACFLILKVRDLIWQHDLTMSTEFCHVYLLLQV